MSSKSDLGKVRSEIFLQKGLDSQISDLPVGSDQRRGPDENATDHADATVPIPHLVQIATFGDDAVGSNHWINGAHAMAHNWPNNFVHKPVKDQKPVDDFFASRLADRIRIDNWRQKLSFIRGEILEIAGQSSQRGLVDLERETVNLARSIERLEALLRLKAPQ